MRSRFAPGNQAQQLVRLEQVAFLAGVQVVEVAAHLAHGLEGSAVFHADEVALHEAALHQAGRHRHFFAAECKGAVELGAKAVALQVFGQQAGDEALDLVVDCSLGGRRQRHRAACDGRGHGLKHLWRSQLKGGIGGSSGGSRNGHEVSLL